MLQTTAISNPLKGRCGWVYENRTTTEQTYIQTCYPYAYHEYVRYKAFEGHLLNEVYPSLVRASLLPTLAVQLH